MPIVVDSTPARTRHALRTQLLLFLSVWFAYGLTINSGNLTAFGLQQAGVEAYVERHHLYLEGSQVELLKVQPVVDAFLYNGHIYPAKQPGQFMAGAIAYAPLRLFGLSYASHYLLTAALVTFLTASLLTALGAVAVFRSVLLLQHSTDLFWPITLTLIYAFATTAFPYSGIAWHDSLATSYLALSFYAFLESERAGSERRCGMFVALGGLLLGLTITTSMLPFLLVVVLSVYYVLFAVYQAGPRAEVASHAAANFGLWRRLALFLSGLGIGLLPLLIYNAICFGNPFLLPNVAGGYRDTFFHFNAGNSFEKLGFYAHLLTIYVPVFWLGIVGLVIFPRWLRREQVLIILLLLASFAYILNIDATGTCQYGPRYLLPAMPFACLGLLGFRFLAPKWRRAITALVLLIAIISFAINLVGALHGAMLCDFPHFAAGLYLSQMLSGQTRAYPLAPWLLGPFIISITLLAWTTAQLKRNKLFR
jgi:hypothetical protein